MLADAGEHQPGTAAGHGLGGSAAQQGADLLEVAPVGGLVGHHPAQLAVHRIVQDGAAETVAVQRLDELGEGPQEQTRQMIEEEGGKALVFGADVTTAAACQAMVGAAVDAFGTVDILVNNIGLASLGTVVDTTEDAWDRAFDINLRTAFLASKYAVPVMAARRRGDRQRGVDLGAARRRDRRATRRPRAG